MLFPAGAGMNRVMRKRDRVPLLILFPAGAGMNRVNKIKLVTGPTVPRRRGDEPSPTADGSMRPAVPRRRGDEPSEASASQEYEICSPQARG